MVHLAWLNAVKIWFLQKSAADLAVGACGLGLAGSSVAFAAFMISTSDQGPRINAAEKLAIFAQPASAPYTGGSTRSPRGPDLDFTPTGSVRARTAYQQPAIAEKIAAGYTMRGYSQGEALVQGPDGFMNVKVGAEIQGLGRVLGIEARGLTLVIVTTGGVISSD
ncbi:MAG: hypothetical protein JWN07_2550 [Hyphomicrobiales bacterium]|nr:hypothetical protein [Hyphomicrobiales bacterium]